MTGPGLPGGSVPPAQEVVDYIRFKFFKSAGQRELEELKGEELNVLCSDVTSSLEEECSTVIKPGPCQRDTGTGHCNAGNESVTSATLANVLPKLEMGVTTSSSTQLHTGAYTKGLPSSQEVLNVITGKYNEV